MNCVRVLTKASLVLACVRVTVYVPRIKMRYLVKARVRPGRETALLQALADGTLGQGSIAGDEYVYDLEQARVGGDGVAHWVETCFCSTPLAEERPYWEKYFELLNVKDAHNRKNCRHENGSEPWACGNCDCTKRLEEKLRQQGESFLKSLRQACEQNQPATPPWTPCAVGRTVVRLIRRRYDKA